MTPRPPLLPRAGAGSGGGARGGERRGVRESGRAAPWKRKRGRGDFLLREEGAAVEVARRGPRWPEAPAAAAREDAAGGSGVPRGRRHRGTAGERHRA